MSHFLRNLVARSLSPAVTLQPRLPSRFEAALRRGELREEHVEVTAAPAAQPTASAMPRATTATSPRLESLEPGLRSEAAAAPTVIPAIALTALPVAALHAPLVPPPAPALVPTFTATPTRDAPAPPAAAPIAPLVASPATLLVERTHDLVREARTDEDEPVVRAATVVERVERLAVATQFAAPTAATSRDVPRAAPLAPWSVAPPAPAPVAPTIHVTIGRVDIRAVPPPAPPPRRAAAERSPAVSLDDYLARRA